MLHAYERIPKQLSFGELADGKRSVGGQKKLFKDTLNTSLKSFDIDINTWDKVAVDRPTWRSLSKKGCQIHEEWRTAGAKKKQELHKSTRLYKFLSGLYNMWSVCKIQNSSYQSS